MRDKLTTDTYSQLRSAESDKKLSYRQQVALSINTAVFLVEIMLT